MEYKFLYSSFDSKDLFVSGVIMLLTIFKKTVFVAVYVFFSINFFEEDCTPVIITYTCL